MVALSRGCGYPEKLLRSGNKLCHPPQELLFSDSFPAAMRLTLSGVASCRPGNYMRSACGQPPYSCSTWPPPTTNLDLLDYCGVWRFDDGSSSGMVSRPNSRRPVCHYGYYNAGYSWPTDNFSSYNPCGVPDPRPKCSDDVYRLLWNWGPMLRTFSLVSTRAVDVGFGPFSVASLDRRLYVRLAMPLETIDHNHELVAFMVSDPLPGCGKYLRPASLPEKSIIFRPQPVYKAGGGGG